MLSDHDLTAHVPYAKSLWKVEGYITSGGFRGGMGGMHPPTSLKVTILAKKSASISNNSAPFRDASPPTSRNLKIPAEKLTSMSVKTFFFYFFLETTWFWAKKTFEFPISAEKSLLILVKTFFFLETTWFWAKKTFEFPISAEKSLSISEKTFFFFFWRPPDFGRKKRMNFRFRLKNHSQFRWRHPNFWGYVLKIPPTKIF